MTPLLVILRRDHAHLKRSFDPGAVVHWLDGRRLSEAEVADLPDADRKRVVTLTEAEQNLSYGDAIVRALVNTHEAALLPAGVTGSCIAHQAERIFESGLAVVRYGFGPVPVDVREADGTWPPGYDTAHEHTNRWARVWADETGGSSIVLCLHANAGGGRYGMVGALQKSQRGRWYAAVIAQRLSTLDDLRGDCREIQHYDDRGTDEKPWRYRGLYVLRGSRGGPTSHAGNLLEPGFLDAPQHRDLWTPEGHERLGATIAQACVDVRDEDSRRRGGQT